MDGLEAVTSITSINGVDGVGGLFAGGQTEVQLGGKGLAEKEAVVAVARLLARNGSTLTRLDLRCFARVLPRGPIPYRRTLTSQFQACLRRKYHRTNQFSPYL